MELAIRQPRGLDLSEWIAGQLSPQTARAYALDLKQFVEWFGDSDLSRVCREDIFRYRAALIAKGYAGATVNRKLSAVRQLFTEAVNHGMIDRSPAEGVKGYKSEGAYSTTRVPSAEQVRALLDSLTGDDLPEVRDLALVSLLSCLGLRRDEAARLRVNSLVDDAGVTCLEIEGKGHKRRRPKIPALALRAVRRWIAVAQLNPEDSLFPRLVRDHGWQLGEGLTGNGIWHICKRRFEAAGIEGCSPHSLRHYFVTELLANGAPLPLVQLLAGHSSPVTTQRYNHGRDLTGDWDTFLVKGGQIGTSD